MEHKKKSKALHAKLGRVNFGGEKYTTHQQRRSITRGDVKLTKVQKNAIEKKVNNMMVKYDAMIENQKNAIRAQVANNENVYAYFVRDATKKVLKVSPVKGKVTVLSPKQLLGMMKTPVACKKSYVHEKVVANPIAGKKLFKKIMGKPKKTTAVKNGVGMGVMGSVQNPFINAYCVKGGDHLYKPTELRVLAKIAGVPAAEIEKAKMSRLKLCDLIRKAKAKTPSPKAKNTSRIRGILDKQQTRKLPGIFRRRYGGLKQPSPPKVASKRRTPSPLVNNNDENYDDIIPWQLRSPRSHARHKKLGNKVYENYVKEIRSKSPMMYLKEIGYDIDRIARKSSKVPDPYRSKNLEKIAIKLSIMLDDVKYTNTNLRKIIRGVINKK